MTVDVPAAGWVASVNRGASGEQSLSLCRSTVVAEGAEQRIKAVNVTFSIEAASVVAAQVVALGGDRAVTISPWAVGDDAVAEYHCAPLHVEDGAAPVFARGIAAERAVVDDERSRRLK